MVKSGSYSVKQPSIFGRIGTGIGQGLAEQVPKEIERSRLASGLKQLGEQKGQTPFQQFSQLSSIPGVTPQMIQSGSELLRQQARGQALSEFGKEQNRPKQNPFTQTSPQSNSEGSSKIPSLTKEEHFAKAQEGFIPRTEDEKFSTAGQKFNANPEAYGGDPQKALDYENQVDITNQSIANANQTKHENLSKIQDNVVNRLKAQSTRLNTEVPAELYSKIEDEAIQATKSKKEKGRGLTEQQAMKEYGDKLNDASRDFSKIDEIGNWGITGRPAKSTLRSLKEIQSKMEKLDQTDNFAKKLISNQQLSPKLAYAIAEPVYSIPSINTFIKQLPKLEPIETLFETVSAAESIPKTLEIAPQLAKLIKDNEKASPLAIAYEIEKKGYDPETWLQYVTDHSKELNLRQRQSEQAATPINIITPWNDWWLSSFSGLD